MLAAGQPSLNFKETKVLLTALRRHQEDLQPLEADGEESGKVSCLSSRSPHVTEACKLHYSGQKGTAVSLPPKNPEEERALCEVTAVLPSLLSREHSDLLQNGLVGKLSSRRQSSSPDSYQYRKEKHCTSSQRSSPSDKNSHSTLENR